MLLLTSSSKLFIASIAAAHGSSCFRTLRCSLRTPNQATIVNNSRYLNKNKIHIHKIKMQVCRIDEGSVKSDKKPAFNPRAHHERHLQESCARRIGCAARAGPVEQIQGTHPLNPYHTVTGGIRIPAKYIPCTHPTKQIPSSTRSIN